MSAKMTLITWWLIIKLSSIVDGSYHFLISIIIQVSKTSLLLVQSTKFTFDMTFFSQQGSRWKDHAWVEFTLTRGFGHVS